VGHTPLIYVADVNLLGDIIDAMKRSVTSLIDANKAVGREVNTERTKYEYMLLCRRQKAGQNHHVIVKRAFENVAQFRYLVTTVTNINMISGEISVCCH
jgi:hypothetical protein